MATLQFSEGSDTPTVLHRKKQLLPNIIDGMAKTRPEAIYAEIPRSRTFYEFGYQKHLRRGKKHETLAYIGPNDLGYIFMVLSAVKAGYKAGNLYATLFDAIANQTTVITILTGAAPSAQMVVDSLKHEKVDAIVIAAPLLEQAAKDQKMLDFITNRIGTITYGGGDVSQATGDAIGTRSKVFNFNGSTETGSYPLLRPSGPYPFDDWKYYHPHPAAGLDFRPSVQGLYEAYIVKNANIEDEQPVFKIFPHLLEYQTKDLFAPHPSKPGLWAYHERADDIIVFKSGFLCNPIAMEQRLSNLLDIRVALMAGTGRYQSALLIEAESDQAMTESEKHSFVEQIWPVVDEANQAYPKDARVSRSHILLADPKIPVQRAGKGTVQRGPTLKLYQDDLDALYTKEGDEMQT